MSKRPPSNLQTTLPSLLQHQTYKSKQAHKVFSALYCVGPVHILSHYPSVVSLEPVILQESILRGLQVVKFKSCQYNPDPAESKWPCSKTAALWAVHFKAKRLMAHRQGWKLVSQLQASCAKGGRKSHSLTTSRFNGREQQQASILRLAPALCFQQNVFKEDLRGRQSATGLFSLSAPAESD